MIKSLYLRRWCVINLHTVAFTTPLSLIHAIIKRAFHSDVSLIYMQSTRALQAAPEIYMKIIDHWRDHFFNLVGGLGIFIRTVTGGYQLAEVRYGWHAHQTAQPNQHNQFVRMAQRLPATRPQRMTDGIIALARDGNQRPSGDWNRRGCTGTEKG